MDQTTLNHLQSLDALRCGLLGATEIYLHDDHRWVLPIILDAQQRGLLPKPCTLVMFDAHHDCCKPKDLAKVQKLCATGATSEALLDLCANDLSTIDDDWIIAGMELGLIRDAVIFGVTHNSFSDEYNPYVDGSGVSHTIWSTYSLPGRALEYQGDLSDIAKWEELMTLWDALSWHNTRGCFSFDQGAPTILLDIDLDCFTALYRDTKFTWPDAVYKDEFQKPSTYSTTEGWSGKGFFDALRDRAGIITIAREPGCCGGEEICKENLDQVFRHLFTQATPNWG